MGGGGKAVVGGVLSPWGGAATHPPPPKKRHGEGDFEGGGMGCHGIVPCPHGIGIFEGGEGGVTMLCPPPPPSPQHPAQHVQLAEMLMSDAPPPRTVWVGVTPPLSQFSQCPPCWKSPPPTIPWCVWGRSIANPQPCQSPGRGGGAVPPAQPPPTQGHPRLCWGGKGGSPSHTPPPPWSTRSPPPSAL